MKIVCSNCESRYSISDEKIRGRNKVFKIKCKNCGHVISIRGTDDGEGEGAEGAAGAEEWYIAVGGERVGPLPLSAVGERSRSGEVTDQTFVWRQGFPDWKRAHEVPEIAALLPAAGATPAEQELGFSGIFAMEEYASAKEASHAAVSTPEGADAAEVPEEETEISAGALAEAPADEAADTLAAAAPQDEEAEEPAAAAATAHRSGADEGLFAAFDSGHPAEADEEEDQGVVTSTGEVEVSAAPAAGEAAGQADDPNMVWQRHESSVLFSLDDYGSKEQQQQAPRPATDEDGDVTDSGLIDIRAIARKESASAGAAGDVFADFGGDDRRSREVFLPLDASAMPILRRRSKAPLFIGIAAAVVVVAAVAVWFLVFQDKGPTDQPAGSGGAGASQQVPGQTPPAGEQPPAAEPVAKVTAPAMAAGPDAGAAVGMAPAGAPDAGSTAGTAAAGTPPAADAGAAQVAAADAAATTPGTVAAAEPKDDRAADKRRIRREEKRDEKAEEKKEPEPKREEKPAPRREEPRAADADALLKQLQEQKKPKADDEEEGKPARTAEVDSGLPARLSASQLRSVVKDFDGKVKACASGGESEAYIRTSITILNSGSVSGARVTSGAAGGVASCVVGVLRTMTFPKFGEPKMTVNIPFKVK